MMHSWKEKFIIRGYSLHILQGMVAHIIVQPEPSMNFISFEAVETPVYIDNHPIILYVFDMFNISTIYQENSLKLKNG